MGKLLSILSAVLVIAVPLEFALANGNHSSALDRKAKRVVEWQADQERRFKALEAESVKILRKMEAEKNSNVPGR